MENNETKTKTKNTCTVVVVTFVDEKLKKKRGGD
jgi:hypothetical protein